MNDDAFLKKVAAVLEGRQLLKEMRKRCTELEEQLNQEDLELQADIERYFLTKRMKETAS